MPSNGHKKREPATVWRMIDAQCRQMSDVVTAARLPFLLSLLWGFMWCCSLYINQFGGIGGLIERNVELRNAVALGNPNTNLEEYCLAHWKINLSDARKAEEFRQMLATVVRDKNDLEKLALDAGALRDLSRFETLRKLCATSIDEAIRIYVQTRHDQRMVGLPGGLPKIHINDLSVVATAGLLLLHSWLFFALRRENHSLQTFVSLDRTSERSGLPSPYDFTLSPASSFLSSEHLVYAYHAVSQRFIFIFSSYSRPLLGVTAALLLFPTAVAIWSIGDDIRDLMFSRYQLPLHLEYGKTFVGIVLVTLDLVLMCRALKFAASSSLLLSGWQLAAAQVWTDEWDEGVPDDPASSVQVNVFRQRAVRVPLSLPASSTGLT